MPASFHVNIVLYGGVVLGMAVALGLGYPLTRCADQRPCRSELVCKRVASCDGGYVKPNSSECGCCPTCVRYLDRGEECRSISIPPEYECAAGLACSEKTGTCVPTPSIVHVSLTEPWVPCHKSHQMSVSCAADGTYAPRQCDINSCYCVTPKGELLPYKVARNRSSRMECVCARVEHALSIVSKHKVQMCDKFGNYMNQDKSIN